MSNLQDITHLHTFHLSSIGRSESAPAILIQAQSRSKTPSTTKKSQSKQSSLLEQSIDNKTIKPNLPRFFSAFTGGMKKYWMNDYEAIGH